MRRLVIFSFIGIFLLTAGLGCKGLSATQQEAIKPVTLNYWRVFDDSDSMSDIIAAYHQLHPQVTINYRKLLPDEFKSELINALAEDRGPDMFSIMNTWVGEYQSKILPMPASVKSVFQSVQGSFSKTTVVNIQQVPSLTPKQMEDRFVSVVAHDAVRNDPATGASAIWGVPLAVDTLVLYYNKDMLDSSGIATPPKTWDDFLTDVTAITKIDANNKIVQSGAAIGSGKNVARSGDILSVLMMQGGAVMSVPGGAPAFQLIPVGYAQPVSPGEQALRFYTDFANPTKKGYTWNAALPDSLDAFARGVTGFFFGYAYDMPLIEARAPQLNYSITALPQLNPSVPVNFASYWLETVSKKTKHPDEAWDFLQFAASADQAKSYLKKTKKPSALRELIASEKDDPLVGTFAVEALTAKSWYAGKDAAAADAAFTDMIDSVTSPAALNDPDAFKKALDGAAARVGQTL